MVWNIGAFMGIVFASGKLTSYLVDNFVFDNASKDLPAASKTEVLVGSAIGQMDGKRSLFKEKEALENELENIPQITFKELKLKNFFSKGRNYFVQIVDDKKELNGHFYHLKRLCRKKQLPLYPFQINLQELAEQIADVDLAEVNKILQRSLRVSSFEELRDLEYVVVNVD